MKGRVAAVFDLDRTLTAGRSVESSFMRFLLQERQISIMNCYRTVAFFSSNIWQDPVKAMKHNKMYLKGCTIETMAGLAQTFLARYGDGLIPPKNRTLVHQHTNSAHLTILITGSPEFLVHPLMPLCGQPFKHLYATRLKVEGGCYTGEIEGIHYYGKAKEQLVRTLSQELGFSLQDSYCYADSESDIPMMALFGKPIAVNPDQELRRASLRSNWQIMTTSCP
ncbi:MAG: HAD family hydrolase [Geobacteraceae bacterium]